MKFSLRGVPVKLTSLMVIFLFITAGAAAYGGYNYIQQGDAIDDAVAVNATVNETNIDQSGGRRGIDYAVDVRFTYEYEGTEYTSDRLVPTTHSPTYNTKSKAESVIEPYETNETVTAYVDPSSPASGFLLKEQSNGLLWFLGGGSLLFVLTLCHAVGARTPGQDTGIRPTDKHEPTRYETLVGLGRDRVYSLSIRLIIGGLGLFVIGLLATVAVVLGAGGSSTQASLTDPLGLAAALLFFGPALVTGGLLIYGIWSFTEYRRLRERIPKPRPPSPFKRPTRLVTIVRTNDGLDEYGRRVKRTGFTMLVVLFFLGFLLQFSP